VTAFFLTAALSFTGAAQKPEPKLDEKVETAREKAVDFLKKQQKDGHWEGVYSISWPTWRAASPGSPRWRCSKPACRRKTRWL
jgi:hypothetical protein